MSKLLWGFLLSGFLLTAKAQTLIIRFEQPVDSKANLLVYIYDKAEGFPVEKEKIFRREIIPVNHTSEIRIKQLPFGTYAIIVVLDGNGNKIMDRNRLGMPAEDYALSGNPKFHFGPPRFEEVKFDFVRDNQVLKLKF